MPGVFRPPPESDLTLMATNTLTRGTKTAVIAVLGLGALPIAGAVMIASRVYLGLPGILQVAVFAGVALLCLWVCIKIADKI
jgi:threonine/homoserine/homoserine lactone efflux protein